MAAKPSFLQNVQTRTPDEELSSPLSDDEPQQRTPSSVSSTSVASTSKPSTAYSSKAHSNASKPGKAAQPAKPSSHGKRKKKKQWRSKSSVDGLVVYSLGLAAAAGVGLWYAWKWWQKRSKSRAATRQAAQAAAQSSSSSQPAQAGGRSAFSFDKPGKGKKAGKGGKSSGGHANNSVAPPVVKTPPIPPATQMRQQPLRQGNPKKDKALRRERKAEKEARKQAAREQAEQLNVAASRAAEATKDEPNVVHYVDYNKTADAYQRVMEWQETGKKRFD